MPYITEVLAGQYAAKSASEADLKSAKMLANVALKAAKAKHPELECFRFGAKGGPFAIATLDMSKLTQVEVSEAAVNGAVVHAQAVLRPKPAATPETEQKRAEKVKIYLTGLTPAERKALIEGLK